MDRGKGGRPLLGMPWHPKRERGRDGEKKRQEGEREGRNEEKTEGGRQVSRQGGWNGEVEWQAGGRAGGGRAHVAALGVAGQAELDLLVGVAPRHRHGQVALAVQQPLRG